MDPRDPLASDPAFSSPLGDASDATPYAKADLVKRFGAALVDGLLANIVALVFAFGGRGLTYGVGLLLAAGYILVRDGLEFDFMARRSIGKKLLKLRPVRLDGGLMDVNASIRRNWTLALGTIVWGLGYIFGGLALYLIAGFIAFIAWLASLLGLAEGVLVLVDSEGRRIGDKMADTQVIESDE